MFKSILHPQLRTKNFMLLLNVALFSRLAERLISIAFILYAIDVFRSPIVAGWITFLAFAPGILISPFAGVILDRYGEKFAISIDLTLNAIIMGIICTLLWFSTLTATNLLILATLLSLTAPLSMAGIRKMLPRLIPVTMLDRANALDTAIYTTVDVVGPAILGILLFMSGYSLVFLLVLIFYIIAATSIALIKQEIIKHRKHLHFLKEAAEAIRLVVTHPTLRPLCISYTLFQVTWGMIVVIMPVVVKSNESSIDSDLLVGLLWALVGIAGAIGALITGQFQTTSRERTIIAIGTICTAIVVWPIMGIQNLAFLAFGLFIAGLVMGPIDVALLSLRQRKTDPAILGRVLAVSISLNLAGFPIGAALGGWFVTISPTLAFATAAAFSTAAAIFSLMIPSSQQPTS